MTALAIETVGRQGASQNVAVTTTSAASTVLGSQTRVVLLVATAACNIRIGDATPTAVAGDTLLPANFPLALICSPGQKVAAITASTATLSVTEIY
ncbi:hypothetical protein H8A95_05145 [Bradyrhizobium sp. Pear76]|uniref:hypothetical protein n=1 Tax=Bradyrhizobium oropedii TaxID=1571201 RepID=UPI001E30123A|nr:hypothetical protein [Bradyrhizobium oropedii]MCC8961721.1 hypothetical protein [Bradyrhizobium oropedii]